MSAGTFSSASLFLDSAAFATQLHLKQLESLALGSLGASTASTFTRLGAHGPEDTPTARKSHLRIISRVLDVSLRLGRLFPISM